MATCFDDLIGIKSVCSEVTGSSGLFIEDMGITADEADMYINSNYNNGQSLIEDKIRFATDLVCKLISNHFSANIITKSFIDSQLLGQPMDSLNIKSGVANNYGGISLNLINYASYFNVFVNSISLQVNVTQNVNVLVYDLISGTLIDTIVVSCTANVISTTVVNKTYSSPKRKMDLIFVYDTTGISSNDTSLFYSTNGTGYVGAGCLSCTGYNYRNYYIASQAIYFPTASAKIRSSLIANSHTFGMSVNYSVQCSIENWLCEIANLMALPILYKAGEEIMNYACYYSNRQTSNVNIDAERNKQRLTAYQIAFNNAIEATIKKINMPKNDACFKCNERVSMQISLP